MSAASDYFASLLEQFTARKDELNALDAAVGDGDHGTTMLRGLTRAGEVADGDRARAFMRASGGASGTLFGLLLLAIERHLVDGADLGAQVRIARGRICELGQVKVGDKSMIDALGPAADILDGGRDAGRGRGRRPQGEGWHAGPAGPARPCPVCGEQGAGAC